MTTDSPTQRTLGAVMSSEAGFEPGLDDAPLRVSGFISFILALLSGFSIVAIPMLGFAIAAVAFGLFALRKTDSRSVPVGTTAARAGILLAVLFGTWGAARYQFKVNTLGNQAEYFARQFVRVASNGNDIYAKELQKSYVNRYLKTMPLEVHYEQERLRQEELRRRAEEDDEEALSTYEEEESVDTTVEDLVDYDPDHEWVLFRPVRVYSHYGRQMAEVVLADSRDEKAYKLRIELEYLVNREDGASEWHVSNCMPFRKRLVAPSIL